MKNSAVSSIHVIAGLDPRYGGPSYSVPRLCAGLAATGVATSLMSVAPNGEIASTSQKQGYKEELFLWDYAHLPLLHGLRASSGMSAALRLAAPATGVIHNHGLWLMPNVYAGREATRSNKPLVVSPRGMLSVAALSFSSWKKRAFWHLLQGAAVRHAACFHATSESEYADIRAFGFGNPIAIIPNGIDIPELHTASSDGRRTVLSFGRVHPIKGLDNLVRAWAAIEAEYPEWWLKIAGPDEGGHASELHSLADSLGLQRIVIQGPLYGNEKNIIYRDADIFVLPSRNENFGLTIAESLAAGTPVISTKGTPWRGLENEGCGWWIDYGVEPLVVALKAAMGMPRNSLRAMGQKGRLWMARDFSWASVAQKTLDVYRWLSAGAPPPPSVRFAR